MRNKVINKSVKYIPSLNLNSIELCKNILESFIPRRKISIGSIKIDKTKFSFNNEIYQWTIDNIVKNFDIDFWDPIIISEDNFLLDWQHRLKACKILKIKYIDVIIEKNIY